jgi:hypothetical protein
MIDFKERLRISPPHSGDRVEPEDGSDGTER